MSLSLFLREQALSEAVILYRQPPAMKPEDYPQESEAIYPPGPTMNRVAV